MKPLPYYLLVLLLVVSSCKKENNDPNSLPKATQEGKNTAGFLLNGQPWLPQKSLTSSTAVGASWLQNYRRILYIGFSRYENSDSRRTEFGFQLPNVRQAGTYVLNQYINPTVVGGARPAYGVYTHYLPSPKREYYTGPTAKGTVILTRFDTAARVVSGTFELTVREDGGSDSLRLTQGRFDLTF